MKRSALQDHNTITLTGRAIKRTEHLLATGAGANNSAALVSAFVEDLIETARRMAARNVGARLDPPLLLALDEIGNLAPLPPPTRSGTPPS